jgi:hypothetical protein
MEKMMMDTLEIAVDVGISFDALLDGKYEAVTRK